MRGWVYIASNESLPNMVKIGYTDQDPSLRMESLSSTGLPTPFKLLYEALVDSPYEAEQYLHKAFSGDRVTRDREFFRVSVRQIVETLREYLEAESASIHLENWYEEDEFDSKYRCTNSFFQEAVRNFRSYMDGELKSYRSWLLKKHRSVQKFEEESLRMMGLSTSPEMLSSIDKVNEKWVDRQVDLSRTLDALFTDSYLQNTFKKIEGIEFDSLEEIEDDLHSSFWGRLFEQHPWVGDLKRDRQGNFQEYAFMCRYCKAFGTSENFKLTFNNMNQDYWFCKRCKKQNRSALLY